MKRTLALLLCLVLMLTLLASCNNDEVTTSSEISELSETSEVSQEPQIPEKVVYYTGTYHEYNSGSILESFVSEGRSGSNLERTGLRHYLEDNEVSDDTYFLIGGGFFDTTSDVLSYTPEAIKETRDFLKEYNFIEINNYFTYDFDYGKNLDEHISAGGNRMDIDASRIESIFPEFDGREVLEEYPGAVKLCFMGFEVIGYISAGALRKMSEHEFAQTQGFSLTWFPAPDDQERWLTFDYDYREQQETSDKIK